MNTKVPALEVVTLGFLMNTKGLVELIVLNIGRDRKVLNDETFAIRVLMALFTTFITTPIVMSIYKPARRAPDGGAIRHGQRVLRAGMFPRQSKCPHHDQPGGVLLRHPPPQPHRLRHAPHGVIRTLLDHLNGPQGPLQWPALLEQGEWQRRPVGDRLRSLPPAQRRHRLPPHGHIRPRNHPRTHHRQRREEACHPHYPSLSQGPAYRRRAQIHWPRLPLC